MSSSELKLTERLASNIILWDVINSYETVYIVLMDSFRVHTKTKQSALSIASFFPDVDECMTGAHKCEQESTACNNTPGGYTCQCKNGYQPAQSLFKCQGKMDQHLFDLGSHSWDKRQDI